MLGFDGDLISRVVLLICVKPHKKFSASLCAALKTRLGRVLINQGTPFEVRYAPDCGAKADIAGLPRCARERTRSRGRGSWRGRAIGSAPTPRSPTTAAATGTARSARARQRASGWRRARPNCSRFPYFHVVFTLPSAIGDIAYQNKAVIYDLLFKASSETMLAIAADPKHLGARIGITSVLHSWGSAMTHHPHLHMIVPGGGLSMDDSRWISCKPNFLLPVRVLSKLVSAVDAGEASGGTRGGQACGSSAHTRISSTSRRSPRCSPRSARNAGSSTPSARSRARTPCSPICRATPTASPSRTVV